MAKKERLIDTKLVVLFLMKIILGKNNHGYAYIINEIWAECARKRTPSPQHKPVSALSICEARMELSDDAIKTINRNIISVWKDKNHPKTGKEHQLFAVDGSKLNIPRGLLEDGYKILKNTTLAPKPLTGLYR